MRRIPPKKNDEPEGIRLRLLAALIAVPIVEFSLFFGCYIAVDRRKAAYIFFALPAWLHVTTSAVALLVGLVAGFAGLTWLLGHLFVTHFPEDKNMRVTAALWLCICVLAFVGYRVADTR